MVIALERRVCFTAPEMAETSRENDFFLSHLDIREDFCPQKMRAGVKRAEVAEGMATGAGARSARRLSAVRLPVDFEQRLVYERHTNLQLWRLWLDNGSSHQGTAGRG